MKNQTKMVSPKRLAFSCAIFLWVGIAGQDVGAQATGKSTQDAFPVLKGPYLGQKWSGPGAELFAPHIVSTGLMEASITFAPGSRACYFDITLPPTLSVIVEIRQEKGIWIAPEVARFSHGLGDGNPVIAPDGKRFYFTSMRSIDGGHKPSLRPNPWVMERAGEDWGPPRPLSIPIGEKQYIMNILPVENGSLYLTLREGQKETICRSRLRDGVYEAPEPLANEINNVKLQMAGYVAPDESYLLFSAFDAEDSKGGSDLYVSFRRPDGSWGTSVNLGSAVNTPDNEFSPYISPDGKYLFFSRFNQRPMPGEAAGPPLTYKEIMSFFTGPQNGLRDIFWIEAGVVDRLRSFPQRHGQSGR
jgi:hypothetical protein